MGNLIPFNVLTQAYYGFLLESTGAPLLLDVLVISQIIVAGQLGEEELESGARLPIHVDHIFGLSIVGFLPQLLRGCFLCVLVWGRTVAGTLKE